MRTYALAFAAIALFGCSKPTQKDVVLPLATNSIHFCFIGNYDTEAYCVPLETFSATLGDYGCPAGTWVPDGSYLPHSARCVAKHSEQVITVEAPKAKGYGGILYGDRQADLPNPVKDALCDDLRQMKLNLPPGCEK